MTEQRQAHEVLAGLQRVKNLLILQAILIDANGVEPVVVKDGEQCSIKSDAVADAVRCVGDLAAQLRALAEGPTAEDYQTAIEQARCELTANTYCPAVMLGFIEKRARELARERSEP